MPKKYQKMKKSFVKKSNNLSVDTNKKKKYNLRKNIRLRRIIENIVLNRGFLNDPNQDILVNPLNDPIEVDISSNNSDQTIKPIQPNHQHLSPYLSLITLKETTSSLAVQDELNGIDYCEFLSMSRNVKEMAGTDSESFLGVFLNPKRINTDLSKEILDLLVEYYCDIYNKDFVALSNIHVANPEAIPVLSKNHKTRFHCKINGDDNSYNIELWKKIFYDLSRDCIIPVYSILGQFVKGSFTIGKRKYMSVILINRKVHV
ncbi:7247_t:CDS:2 [Funneliformis caledonium]|uniref:7247_t:CDS:1 n=1 Tax=Funneliformis caledonium TaxID=1117310 RepID=A0A9N9DVQ3_9GLOM|nr:7247_t:CDS:2 [Funneliformis caledonium]